jgi:hypothetical protein
MRGCYHRPDGLLSAVAAATLPQRAMIGSTVEVERRRMIRSAPLHRRTLNRGLYAPDKDPCGCDRETAANTRHDGEPC